MSVLKWGLGASFLGVVALAGCQAPQGAPLSSEAMALPWAEGAVLGAAPLRPHFATGGEGLAVRVVLPKALQWVSPSPWSAADIRSLRYELWGPGEVLVAQREDYFGSGLPAEPPPVLLRNLKRDVPYALRAVAFAEGNVLISKGPESTFLLEVNEYSGNHDVLNLPLQLIDRIYPGRLSVHLGNQNHLRYLAVDRRTNDNPVTWSQMYTVFMPDGPSVTTFEGFAPDSWVRVRITPFEQQGDSAGALGPTDFQEVQIVLAEADASGTTHVYESE